MTDLEKFQNKRKESLFETIFSPFWRALEDLGQAMAGTKRTGSNGKPIASSEDQISVGLDNFENRNSKK